MSISNEITRLQTAKADIKTSIENKGVTVPSSTKLDGYPTLIDSIPSGGGGLSTGTKTTNANARASITFTGLSGEPKTYCLHINTKITISNLIGKTINYIDSVGEQCGWITRTEINNVTTVWFGTKRVSTSYESGTFTITINDTSSLGEFKLNTNYRLAYTY